MENLYMGHTPEFWLTLKEKADNLNAVKLLKEICELRGHVSYYESRIDELTAFKMLSNAKLK